MQSCVIESVTRHAYAKINTFLAVTGRLDSGYHTVLSHMQAVSLCDTLRMTWQAGDGQANVTLHCDDGTLACDGSNLICRAAHAIFAALSPCPCGHLEIFLQKRIPVASGLAGGSADAAATLLGVNELLGFPLTLEELCDIGKRLGADIPFCLRAEQGAMTARGIGERLQTAFSLPSSLYLVVARCGEGVYTPLAYRRLDECGLDDGDTAERRYADLLAALRDKDIEALAALSYNCFEQVVLPTRPDVRALKQCIWNSGAAFALMSGSGPAVVGYFENGADAKACVKSLREQGIIAHLCQAIGNGSTQR